MAARIGIFLAADNGVNAPSNSGSGCSRLSVGGATPWEHQNVKRRRSFFFSLSKIEQMIANCRWRTWWIASTVKIASTDPAAPSRWPIAPWGKSSRWHKIGHEGNRGNLVAAPSGELPSSRIMQDHRMLHDHQIWFWLHSPPQRRLIVVQIQINVSILFMVTLYSSQSKTYPQYRSDRSLLKPAYPTKCLWQVIVSTYQEELM